VWCSRARADGYRAALENAEIAVNSAFILHGDLHVESGHEQRDELLRLQNRPTEVFAESDLQTLGLYRADLELDCGSSRTCQSPMRTTCPSRGG
jgi:DNA-binding LacI/PurR family transcriptional regulator